MISRLYLIRHILFWWMVPMMLPGACAAAAGQQKVSENVGSSLRAVIDAMHMHPTVDSYTRNVDMAGRSIPLVRVDAAGNIQTYIYVHRFAQAQRAELELYGAKIDTIDATLGVIQAWLPYQHLDAVAQLAFVKRITAPAYSTPRVGSTTSEGDAILRAATLRELGFDGRGVKIGVIGPGVDNLAISQASGDLPAVTVLTHVNRGDEGTAILEIIHDVAPGAELGFCGPDTSLEMMNCVKGMVETFGADIIMDDLGFLLEPFFEDGPVAQTVANAIANGAIYATAAGNDAQKHYEGDFIGTTLLGLEDLAGQPMPEHNFGLAAARESDPTLDVLVPSRASLIVILQWNDPFGAAQNDYDLFLMNEAATTVLSRSVNLQDGDDDPLEALAFVNQMNQVQRVKVVVARSHGEDRVLKILLSGNVILEEYHVPNGSIFGHPAVPGVLATAAIAADDTGHDTIERFSSRGPVRIFFPLPESRQKPDVTAIDGVSITGAGGFASPFFGTSAAVPHVAGIAALLKSAAPTATATDIINALKSSAVDLGAAGPDAVFGFGRVDALGAVQILNPAAATANDLYAAVLPSSRSVQLGTSATAFATIMHTGPTTAVGCRIAPATHVAAPFVYQTTDPLTNTVTGTPNTPVDIPPYASQSFVFAFTPSADVATIDIALRFDCSNRAPAASISGLNTLLLSASAPPIPDIVAIAATLDNDGIVHIPGHLATGVFAVATVNVGASEQITVSVNTSSPTLPVNIAICETAPATGVCLAPPTERVTAQMPAGTTSTFGIFVRSSDAIPFDPANNRLFVRFHDAAESLRGATSVAVTTQ